MKELKDCQKFEQSTMGNENKDTKPIDLELVAETVDSQAVVTVTASYLIQNRERLEAYRVPIYLVTAKVGARFQVVPMLPSQISALVSDGNVLQEFALPRQWNAGAVPAGQPLLSSSEDAFFVRWNALMAMSPAQRVQELSRGREDFERKSKATSDPSERSQLVVGIAELAFLVNRASLSLNKATLTGVDHALVQETTAIIHSVVAMVEERNQALTLFQTLHSLSNGHTLNHIVSVFSTMVAFLVFYNTLHAQGLNQKIRLIFAASYRDQYLQFLPGLRESLMTSDNLVRLPHLSLNQVRTFALGALMHDIGKVLDLGYFENGAVFDAVRIKQHPILGSGLFQKTYGEKYDEARFIVGDHHNYLFHGDGYGLSRWDRTRSLRGRPEPTCCVADTLETFDTGQSLGFLPVEICAVIDVYDALTDPSRLYKTPLSPEESIVFMDEHFRATRKIDPIVFDLFIDFLKATGIALPEEMGLQERYDRQKTGKRA